MWHETPGWEQQGSFVQPVPIPSAAIDDAPQVCVQVNVEWLPYVLGSLMQLVQPSSWIAPSQAALDDVLGRATDLIGEIGNAVICSCPILRLHDCVLQVSCDAGVTWTDATDWAADFPACVASNVSPPIPPNPIGTPPAQQACNLAGWLASQVLQAAVAAQAANRAAANDENSLVKTLLNSVFGGSPFISGIINAGYALFVTDQSFPATDLTAASTDAALLTAMTKAIFDATHGTGYVDATGFAQAAVNLAAISYPAAAWVPVMLANFWTQLTLTTIQSMQAKGALNTADCSAIGGPWCNLFDFTVQSYVTTAMFALNNAQYHMTWDGTAWVADGPGLGGQSWGKIQLADQAGAGHVPVTLTYMEVGMSRAVANTDVAVVSNVEVFNGPSLTGTLALSDSALGGTVYSATFSPPILMNAAYVFLFADSGDLRLDYVKVKGTSGPSPWSPNTCAP